MTALLDEAVKAGFTVMRTWAHGVSSAYPVLLGPGRYNEGMLRGLDFALDEARKRGLKASAVWFDSQGLSHTHSWAAGGLTRTVSAAHQLSTWQTACRGPGSHKM